MQGSVVQAATPEEQAALDAFLNWVAESLSWGRRGWDRAELAKDAC